MVDHIGTAPRALGPLDRRTIVRRCAACAKRKVKCQGGSPCGACRQRNEPCVPQTQARGSNAIFVNVSDKYREPNPTAKASTPRRGPQDTIVISSRMPGTLRLDYESLYLGHFFSNYLKVNNFTGKDSMHHSVLTNLCHQSPILTNSMVAIGALDVSRGPGSSLQREHQKSPKLVAIQAYRDSILQLRSAIADQAAAQSDAVLWGTLFLGLFELMADATGQGWLSHISYGTYSLLQLREPQYYVKGTGRSFFLMLRIFEICRSLMSAEDTFLAQSPWKDVSTQIWADSKADWHPKEALFDILVEIASCSSRAMQFVNEASKNAEMPEHEQVERARYLGNEGKTIQAKLLKWYAELLLLSGTGTGTSTETDSSPPSSPSPATDSDTPSTTSYYTLSSPPLSSPSSSSSSPSSAFRPVHPTSSWPLSSTTIKSDPQLMIALAYYHGISIFLSGTYDSYPYWTPPAPAPILSASEIQGHVMAILEICQYVFQDGTLAPVLLVMPLQVAGIRSHLDAHRQLILQMLREIAKRGFVVADRFAFVLQLRWAGFCPDYIAELLAKHVEE